MRTENEAQAEPQDYNLKPLIQGYEFAKEMEWKRSTLTHLYF